MIALSPPRTTPAVPPDHQDLTGVVSASRLNCFHTCRLKFFFRYVVKLVKPATAALFVGKAVHAAFQQWSVARWRGQPRDAETLKAGFLMSWITGQEEEPVAWQADEDAQQEKAWGLVDMYLRETPIPDNEKPEAVEVRVEADLAEHGLPTLLGFIDLVRPGGRIVDFKTSAATPNAEQVIHRNETQLTAYGLLYREATGKQESGFELHHLVKTKTPKLVSCNISRFGYKRVSLILAFSLVNCQLMGAPRLLRAASQAATSARMVARSGMRRFRHWLCMTRNSISAILSQLPCLGM